MPGTRHRRCDRHDGAECAKDCNPLQAILVLFENIPEACGGRCDCPGRRASLTPPDILLLGYCDITAGSLGAPGRQLERLETAGNRYG